MKIKDTRHEVNCEMNILSGTPITDAILKPANIHEMTEAVKRRGATSGANDMEVAIKTLETAAKKIRDKNIIV